MNNTYMICVCEIIFMVHSLGLKIKNKNRAICEDGYEQFCFVAQVIDFIIKIM